MDSPFPSHLPPNPEILAAGCAISTTLKETPYALVGSAACLLLGSPLQTNAIDIVVPRGLTISTRNLLKNNPDAFEVDSRTRHTYFKSEHEIDINIVTPPGLFRGTFDEDTKTIEMGGVRILHPALLLDELCGGIMGRPTEEWAKIDAENILFLLGWLGEDSGEIQRSDVPNANRTFAQWFVEKYGGEEHWKKVSLFVFETQGIA